MFQGLAAAADILDSIPFVIQASARKASKRKMEDFCVFARKRGVKLPDKFEFGGIVGGVQLDNCGVSETSSFNAPRSPLAALLVSCFTTASNFVMVLRWPFSWMTISLTVDHPIVLKPSLGTNIALRTVSEAVAKAGGVGRWPSEGVAGQWSASLPHE